MRTWRLQFDNPDFSGWLVVTFYLAAAICCARTAGKGEPGASTRIWWGLAAGLVFLGVNKQLNLQTLIIDIGRQVAFRGGWYDRRRLAQTIFCAGLSVVLLGMVVFFATEMSWFIKQNPLALAGICVLVCFVILRAITMNHENKFMGRDLNDKAWAWVLEVSGSAMIGISAVKTSHREG